MEIALGCAFNYYLSMLLDQKSSKAATTIGTALWRTPISKKSGREAERMLLRTYSLANH